MPAWLLADEAAASHTHRGGRRGGRAPLQAKTALQANTDLERALFKLDPTNYQDFHDWLRIIMACHAGGMDLEVFVAWSTSDPKYADAGDDIRRMWDKLKPDGGITVATLFAELRRPKAEEEPVHLLPSACVVRRHTPYDMHRINRIRDKVRDEDSLFWAACRYGSALACLRLSEGMLGGLLMSAGWSAGLRDKDRMRRQIANGFRIGRGGKWDSEERTTGGEGKRVSGHHSDAEPSSKQEINE
jgi:hypothetical protein